jgi:hypothetical protein
VPNGEGHDPRPLWKQVKEDYAERIVTLEKENRSLRDQLRAARGTIDSLANAIEVVSGVRPDIGEEPK